MRLSVFCADPAGNITLFVLSAVERDARAETAKRLMAAGLFGAEQVAFVLPPPKGADGAIEMMGGEFCGNAARSYGAYLSAKTGKTKLTLCVSGCEESVAVEVEGASARAQMPKAREVRRCAVSGVEGTLVDLGGIAHFVTDCAPSEEFFEKAERALLRQTRAEAYGVIFLDRQRGALTPLVKVVSTDTLVWESSCGSGTLAAALAESFGTKDGVFERAYAQRAGVISSRIVYRGGAIERAYIGGTVAFGGEMSVEI